MFGIPADMDALLAIGKKHAIPIIEDCAQAQGARYKGKYVGTMGAAACFSFFPSKNLGTFGDGGAMTSPDTELVKKVRVLANHGRRDKFHHEVIGTNSRLDTIKAAQLSVCLRRLDAWNADRRRAAALYAELLKDTAHISLTAVPEGCEPIWHVYVIRHKKRDALAAFLQKKGIGTGLHYPLGLHQQPVYAHLGLTPEDLPGATAACAEVLSLPMFPFITEEEITAVAQAIQAFCAL